MPRIVLSFNKKTCADNVNTLYHRTLVARRPGTVPPGIGGYGLIHPNAQNRGSRIVSGPRAAR